MTYLGRKQINVIPAIGWKVLNFEGSTGDVYLSEELIAFIIDVGDEEQNADWGTRLSASVTPVSMSGSVSDALAFESPSGRITIPRVADFDTREQLREYWQTEAKAKK